MIVDDDLEFLAEVGKILTREKYSVTSVSSYEEAADHIRKVKGKSIILSELKSEEGYGLAFLKDTLRMYPGLPFTFLSMSPSLESVIEALKQGAYDFLRKPVAQGILLHSVARSIEKLNLSLESEKTEKDAGERLSKMQADLKRAKIEVEMISFMISMAAHDFRSALTVLEWYSRGMEDVCSECPSRDGSMMVRQIGRSARKLRAMANTLLDFEAARRGELQLEVKSFELGTVLKDCIAFYQPYAEQKQISLKLLDVMEGLKVKADPERVMQVLDNILYNAIKFTPRNGRIEVGARQEGGKAVTVCVEDTGQGMTKEQVEKIFKEELIAAAKDQNSRIGLGLYICKKLLEVQSGKIWVESNLGKGTKVYFSLPV